MNDNPTQGARDATLRYWRRMQVLGGLIVTCCFFLPAVEGCNEWIVPAGEAWEVVDNIQHARSVTAFVGGIALFASPYIWGLWAALGALRSKSTVNGERQLFGFAIAPLIFCAVSAFFIQAIAVNGTPRVSRIPTSPGRLTILVLAILTLFYLLRVRWVGPLAMQAANFWGGMLCVSWFVLWTLLGAMIGVHLALLGSVMVVMSAVGQAQALSRLTRVRLLLRMLIAAPIPIHDPAVCSRCGYDLRGLPEPRCPECGTPFEPIHDPT